MIILIPVLFIITAALSYSSHNVRLIRKNALIMGLISAAIALYWFSKPFFSIDELNFTFIHLDRFSSFIGILIILLYFFTIIVSHRYIGEEHHEGILKLKQVQLYFFLLPIFVLAMLTVVAADNIGLLWLALETTTLASTPLVAIYKKEGSLEAAWKYIILCSLGISLGLLGILLISYAGSSGGLSISDSLSLKILAQNASQINPAIIRWAFVFIFIGLGTKVGFFPMHTWLPDAHGRTPSPISAMLSGILLNVALYALIKIKFITDGALNSDQWTNNFFLTFGILSVTSSALYIFIQHQYKRMLAYSSIEHMGILAISIGLGAIGLVPALMHMFAHSFSKSLLFYGSGEILLHEKTAQIDKTHHLFRKIPLTSGLFIIGLLALLAVPPFATFASEIYILEALAKKGRWIIFGLLLLALSIVCVSLFKHTFKMFCLEENPNLDVEKEKFLKKEKVNLVHIIIIVQITVLASAGIWFLTSAGVNFFSHIAQSIK